MSFKLSVFLFVAVAFVTGQENDKRQFGSNFNEYFNKFQEHMKPFIGSLPQLPNGIGSGSLPEFPSFPGTGGSASQNPSKRQASPYTISEWMSQFGQGNKPVSGNLPFKPPPPFGNLPFGNLFGGSSNSNEETEES